MHKKYLGATRREAVAAAASATLALAIRPGAAAATPPRPQGDDVAYLTFAGVAEGVAARLYGNARQIAGAWTRAERELLHSAGRQHLANVRRVNAGLEQQDMIRSGAFERVVVVRNRSQALRTGIEIEGLLIGTYLDGITNALDPVTRLLLGRMGSAASRNRGMLSRLAGRGLGGMPGPIDLDVAGERLDSYIRDPS